MHILTAYLKGIIDCVRTYSFLMVTVANKNTPVLTPCPHAYPMYIIDIFCGFTLLLKILNF